MIDPDDYWVNNPLITPINKALMYDMDIFNAKQDEQERIIDLINDSGSRNYLTEEQCLDLIDAINGHNLPSRFRDISNGE